MGDGARIEGNGSGRAGRDVVFVSYSHTDRPWLDRLLVLLTPLVRNKRMQVWADPYLQVGADWRRSLTEVIDRAGVAVLLVSGDFLASRFIMDEELPQLVTRGVRLAPVLVRDCLWEHEPLLQRVQWAHDPGGEGPLDTGGDSPRDRDGRLVRICRSLIALVDAAPGPGRAVELIPEPAGVAGAAAEVLRVSSQVGSVDEVPPLPPGYLKRADLQVLWTAVLQAATGAVGLTGNAAALGLHGQGGIGKTVLAAAVALDERVRSYFPDGVFWVTLGEHADPVAAQVDLLARLGRPGLEVRSASDGLRLLRETLAGRRVLLVADDVWSDAAAAAFRAAGPLGRVLYTSRDARVLAAVDARAQQVEVLPEPVARQLLASISGTPVGALPEQTDRVLAATGRVPLALALVGAAVRGGMSWSRLAAGLQEGADTFLDHPYANTFKAMQVATAGLPPGLLAAYVSLAVYPPDTVVPVAAVTRFWVRLRGITAQEVRADLAALAEAELLRLVDGQVTFHDLQHDYLVLQADDLAVLHADLLAAYRDLLPDGGRDGWWRLPLQEPYISDHLVHHLGLAGDRAGVRATVTDVAYLACRISSSGVHAAEADLAIAGEVVPDEARIGWLRGWLARHSHLLTGLVTLGDVAAAMRCWLRDADPGMRAERLDPLLPPHFLQPVWGLRALPVASRRTLTGHTNFVTAVAFSPDGRLLASAGYDGTVRLWEPDTGREQAVLTGHTGGVLAVAFSPDGQLLATAGDDQAVRLWEPDTGREQAVLTGHTGWVRAVAFSPDGQLLASAGTDGTVRLWEPDTGREQAVLTGHTGGVSAVAFSPDGQLLATAGTDQTVRLWEPDTGREQAVLTGHTSWVRAVAFSPDGQLLASAGYDETVRLWEPHTGREQAVLTGHTSGVSAVAFSPDGQLLATAGNDQAVRLWEPHTGREQAVLTGHTDWVQAVAFSPDGQLLATAGDDQTVRLWEPDTGREQAVLTGHTDWVQAVAFSPDGQLLATAGDDQTVRLWEPDTGREQAVLTGHTDWVQAVAFSPDGQLLATAGDDQTVRLWEPDTGRERAVLTGHTGGVNAVAFSPDGRVLASGDDRTVRLWEPDTGRERAVLTGHTGGVNAVAFSPDGRVLASGDDRTVRLWEPDTGRERAVLTGHTGGVNAVAFSPDGQLLASTGDDRTVRLWQPHTGREKAALTGHTGWVNAVAFSPDGRLLASAGDDGTVRVWDANAQLLVHQLPLGRPITSMAWGPSALSVTTAESVVALHVVAVTPR